ncbi:MAG: monovalent cation/H+ antiporter complex subunit F [Gemmatimonadota bacterium]|nr:monovalent cation/H+ antiporter complex subunit F [Gemmatimonadota bacterium]
MIAFLYGIALLLLLSLALGLVRVARGPTRGDRMVAAQLFGTHGVATLLVLATATDAPVLRDVALVFALLAAVISVTFVKRGWMNERSDSEDT